MLRLILRRLALGLVTIALVSLIIFLGLEALPGDACTAFLQQDARGDALRICREQLGLNVPRLPALLFLGLRSPARRPRRRARRPEDRGDRRRPAEKYPPACGVGHRLGVPLALALGILTALRRDKATDLIQSTAAIMAMTIRSSSRRPC